MGRSLGSTTCVELAKAHAARLTASTSCRQVPTVVSCCTLHAALGLGLGVRGEGLLHSAAASSATVLSACLLQSTGPPCSRRLWLA